MNIFKSDSDSHQHSLETLNLIANYDDFMDSITTICDMGCGVGLDLAWWATKTYLDENGAERPHNYKCLGIDLDLSRAAVSTDNMRIMQADFEEYNQNIRADVIWSHDSFRYATNPLGTLKNWNLQMNDNGMLVLIVPQNINITYNKPVVRSLPGNYFHYTITNLLYMLAVNGFDCHDGHFVKHPNDPWIHCVVYKSEHEPMNPRTTSWYDLCEKKLLPESAMNSVKTFGLLKQEDIQTHWLSGQFCNWNQV